MPSDNTSELAVNRPPGRKRRLKRVRPDLTHWPQPWEFTVRGAVDAEGEAIHELVDTMTRQYGWTLPACDWSRVAPFWYVADVGGVLVGAVQLCIGRPICRLELLAVRPTLSKTKQAKIVKALLYHAFAAARLDGAALVCALISAKDDHFSRVIERWGAKFAVTGKMFFYPLITQE